MEGEEPSSDFVSVELNEDNHEHEMLEIPDAENKIDEPKKGMKFDSIDELSKFYLSYARQKGFAVSVRSSQKVEGVTRYVKIACTRGGKPRIRSSNPVNMRPHSKINCKAKVCAVLCLDEKWKVNDVELEHNHEMTPSKSRFYKCNRLLDPNVKRRLELNDRAGIRLNKNFNSFVVEAGAPENLSFLEKDCRNYINKVRRLQLGEGDANAMHNYFLKMQADNSEFFYMMDLDEDGRLRNIFWADARSRATFKEFGDVVTFDTTYLVNKYDMPFAPFVGVNHHGQSVLLGCGLISNEDTETFTWLFQSWLTCMYQNPPKGIVTDQDNAMKKAIEIVFPNARHRWCLWHIMKKVPDKLKGYEKYESIKFCMQNVVYNSLTKEEFEDSWGKFIEKYDLRSNKWLLGMYDERHRWVPAFVKDMFWAGMSTTQRSESMHAFFDGYINSKTTLKQFVEQYENALAKKVENENQEEFNSVNSNFPCITQYEMEKQFQSVFTRAKFKEFQQELVGNICCNVFSCKESVGFSEYEIREDVPIEDGHRSRTFKLHLNEESGEVSCNCRLFEFRGIICRHQIKVYTFRSIFVIPDKYIFQRWSKMVNRCHTKVRISYDNSYDKPEARRLDKIVNFFYEIANMAAGSEDLYNSLMGQLLTIKGELKENIEFRNSNRPTCINDASTSSVNDMVLSKESTSILDPLHVRGKGRPIEKVKKSFVDKAVKKKREKMNNVKKATTKKGVAKNNDGPRNELGIPRFMGFGVFGTQESQHNGGHLNREDPNMQLSGSFPSQENMIRQRLGIQPNMQPNNIFYHAIEPQSHQHPFWTTRGVVPEEIFRFQHPY